MVILIWIAFVFLFGIVTGSFLNVCIARLPMQKSLVWPGSRCGRCFQPIPWYDNIPLISYLLLRGRCRTCKTRFSFQYLFVELLTGLGFVGLFYLEVVLNIHKWPAPLGMGWAVANGFYPWQWWVGFAWHAVLFAFLMAAAFCDLQRRFIPLSITLTGTCVGLIGAVLLPWPFPHTPGQGIAKIRAHEIRLQKKDLSWWDLPKGAGPEEGVYPWPVWGPIPAWLKPGGNWQMGLATGLAGMLAGTLLMRMVAFLFSRGLGKEALGLGDADIMMMAGAFLGWQPVVAAFFISVFPGLLFGVFQLVVRKDNSLPFGPALGMGVVIAFLGWPWIGPALQSLFFWDVLLISLAVLAAGFMLAAGYLIRLARPTAEPQKNGSTS